MHSSNARIYRFGSGQAIGQNCLKNKLSDQRMFLSITKTQSIQHLLQAIRIYSQSLMRQSYSNIIIRRQMPELNRRRSFPIKPILHLPPQFKHVLLLAKKNSIIYSKSMNFAYFPLRQFTEALGVTAKVKSRLQPFLEEVENYNMEWLFQMLMELHAYTVATDCPLPYKFNALVALKLLLDTCELPVVIMVEVYFLPHVRRIATYQLQASQKHRGLDYFLAMGYPKGPEVKKLGYNYVRLASEIVTMMAVVKPYRLYKDEELAEASEFFNVLQIMRAQQWREYDMFAFYQVDETLMRDSFLRKLKAFTRCQERYYDFFDTYLDKFIRKEYSPKVLDPRKILEAGEVFACSHVLQELGQLLKQDRASIKGNVLKMFTDFVRWGYIQAAYLIECEGIFEDLVKQARSAKGGKGVFRNIHGSEEQKRNLYYQLVRSLQIWAVCIPKNPMSLMEESRCSLAYKQFLQQHVQVPFSSNIKKIRDECQGNLQKNQLINLLIMKEFKKNDFDASKMRRTSSNLEELINMENMSSSMAALIMQAKFISDIAKPEIDSSSSSLSTSNPGTRSRLIHFPAKSTTHNLQASIEPAKENREPRSKQLFNKYKTVCLSNLLCRASQNTVTIADGQNYMPECESDEENFDEECDQNSKINEVRSPICGQNAFKSHKIANKVIEDRQPQAAKLTIQQRKDIEQQQMVQFFQETIHSPTNTITSQHFDLEANKPSPRQSETNTLNSDATTPNISNRVRKEKASLIFCKQHLRLPTRRNELTVDPFEQRGQGRPKRIRNSWEDYLPEDHQDRANNHPPYVCIDFSRFEPFLREWVQMEGKKGLMRNKDVLLKNSKIEIGFIVEPRTHQTLLLNLFITPSEHITKLKYEVACPPTVTCSERGERFNEIAKHKQRKLMLHFWVKPPYCLPTLAVQYEMQGKAYQHTLFLPVSFNKFVKYSSKPPRINNPMLLKTQAQKLNTKDFHPSQLASIFPDFTMHNEDGSFQLAGGGQYQGKAFGLSFLLRDATHLQICTQLSQRERKGTEWVQFLMAVLLATLRK